MHLIIYGPEGSGKGTQAELLGKKFNLPVYTAGDLVREAVAGKDKDISEICRKALNSGSYVDDKTMFFLLENKLSGGKIKRGFILDGFPRSVDQAKFLFERVKMQGFRIDGVIYLELSDEEAIKRLIKRGRKLFSGSSVSHDTPERIRERLKTYHKKERPLISFFQKKRILLEIDGENTIEEIHKEIIEELELHGFTHTKKTL